MKWELKNQRKVFVSNLPSHTYRMNEKCMAKPTDSEPTPIVKEINKI
jgi:hypothetical protein